MATVENLKGGRRMPDGVMAQWLGDEKEPKFMKQWRATAKLSKARTWTGPMLGFVVAALLSSGLSFLSAYAVVVLAGVALLVLMQHSVRVTVLKKAALKFAQEAEEKVRIIKPADEEEAA